MLDTCCTCGNSSSKMYCTNTKVYGYQSTIKNIILQLVPDMECRLQDNDIVCFICKRLMHQCLKFIAKCLEINTSINTNESFPSNHKAFVRSSNHSTDNFLKEEYNTNQHFGKNEMDAYGDDSNTQKQYDNNVYNETESLMEKDVDQIKYDNHNHQKTDHDYHKCKQLDFLKGDVTSKCSGNNDIYDYDDVSDSKKQYADKKYDENDSPMKDDREQITAEDDNDQNKNHDYYKGESLAISKLEKRPSSVSERSNRILSVRLPQIVPKHFVTSLIDMKIQVFGCSENEETNLKNKRLLLVGNRGQGIKCEHCIKIFSNKKYLEQHRLRHTDPKERRDILQLKKRKLIKQKYYANKQQQEKTKEERFGLEKNGEASYICEYCGKSFLSLVACSVHKESHTKPKLRFKKDNKKENKTFICHICGAVFKNNRNIRNHINNVHCSELTCKICSKVIKSRSSLKRHIVTKHMNMRVVQCEECGRKFRHLGALKRHRSLVHQKEIKCICPHCGEGFNRNDYLKRHIKRHAEGGCGRKKGIKRRTTKIGERRHKCSKCSMTFVRRDNLVRHEKTHLDDTGQFKCHVCWKSFAEKSAYDEHLRYHEKPYICSCGESFGRRFALTNHLYSDHPDEGSFFVETVLKRYPQKKRSAKERGSVEIATHNRLHYY